MKKGFVLIFFILISNSIWAQTVTVLNQEDNNPIYQVTIQEKSSDFGAITDAFGVAELSNFDQEGTLIFRHPSFKPVIITFQALRKQSFVLYMYEEITEMEDVLISANKWEQNKREIPQEIAEFERDYIAKVEPLSTADLLGSNSEVFIQKSQLGGGSPMIRGFAANSVLIVIDGVRMNNAIYRSGNLQNVIMLDPSNLQEAEVVFGPGSVIYGSDALGGVMDFHTISPNFSNEGFQLGGSGFTRYSSAANAVTGNLNFQLTEKRFTSFTSFTYSTFGDLRTGSNRTDKFPDYGKRYEYVERMGNEDVIVQNDNVNLQVQSGYDQFNFLQKFSWKTGAFSDLTYSFHYSNSSDIPRYDRLTERDEDGNLRHAEWYYGPQRWQMHSFQMRYFYPTKFFDQAKIITAFQRVEESRLDRRFQRDLLRSREENVDVLSLNIDFERSFGINNELYYGIELLANQVDSEAMSTNIITDQAFPESTRYPDGGSTYNAAAAYLSFKNELNQKLILSTGLRYNFIKVNSQFEDDTFYDFPYDEIRLQNGSINGSLGIVYLPNNTWKLNALFSTGFRSPNVDDIGKVFDSEPGVVIVPNPDLKPENSYNFEYGFTKNFANDLEIGFVNYFTRLDNAMVRRASTFNGQSQIIYDGVLSDVFAEVNVGEAYVWGLTARFKQKLKSGFVIYGNVTYTDGEDTVENIPLRHVTPLFGEMGVSYEPGRYRFGMVVRFSDGIAFEDLAPAEQNKPHFYTEDGALSWATLNVYNSYQLSDRLSFTLNLENILDTHYRTYSSGISAPGFNATASLRVTF